MSKFLLPLLIATVFLDLLLVAQSAKAVVMMPPDDYKCIPYTVELVPGACSIPGNGACVKVVECK